MNPFRLSRIPAVLLFLAFSAVIFGTVWRVSYATALAQLDERAESDLVLSSDRLEAVMQRYRDLAVYLADNPMLRLALTESAFYRAQADQIMQALADKTGEVELVLVDAAGAAVAGQAAIVTAGTNPAVERAATGALGRAIYLEGAGERWFTFASPVFAEEGPAIGAVLAATRFDSIEANWPAEPNPVFFTDESGTVLFANRSDLVLLDRRALEAGQGFPHVVTGTSADYPVWRIDGGPYLPAEALHRSRELPRIGMMAEILVSVAPAKRIARLQAAAAGGLLLALGMLLFLASERRRTLAARLEIEEAAKRDLEVRVQERTRELTEANVALRHEVQERQEAEAALRQAQADLVQAGKLAALGQMSAGLSHELNQPLMAIRSFAENATEFLERGKTEIAAQNLTRISELSRRMARIIRNLRAFARQEQPAIGDVDLVAVTRAALELQEPRMRESGVSLDWAEPEAPVIVRGGEVRLQQVVLNLVTNALDAMQGRDRRVLTIRLTTDAGVARLEVRDTGSGISDPAKIFDPFYTTKEVGQSEGMGLGLSISYGLVQSFGGTIRGDNHPEGGAVFTVELILSGEAA